MTKKEQNEEIKKEILKQLGFTVNGDPDKQMLFDNIISQAMNEFHKYKINQENNDCITDAAPKLELAEELIIIKPDSDNEFEIACTDFNFFISKIEAKQIADFIYSHLIKQ